MSRLLPLGAIILVAISFRPSAIGATPTVLSVNPAPGSVVSALSQVAVTFSVPVVGVQASDLEINGLPALAVTVSNAVVTFLFSQPPPGGVAVNFDSDAAITDQVGNFFDPFAPSAAWTCSVTDLVPPVVARLEPAAGAVVASLSEVEVDFSEAVTGVDASDFRVNGVASSSVTALAPERYRFSFVQPASGAISITWGAGHSIRDLSPAGNAFSGAGWTYNLSPVAAAGDVVINEFLAENRNSLEDADGQKEDWIELRNRGANAVNLTGWSLTDDPGDPGKWVFPSVTLGVGQYLIVFASGKDLKTSAANATNHTNFRLNIGGGYLGLFNSGFPRSVVSEFTAYPEQRADISYGLAGNGSAAYFSTFTPGTFNSDASAVAGFVQPPHASVKSGFFDQPFNLVLSTATAGAVVHYTLDGSIPTTSSELYTAPINIAGDPSRGVVMVRAVGFKTGNVPSSVTTRTYIFPDHVLTQPANPAGFPSIWDSPCTGFNNCNDINPADYEMDPQVITNTVNNYRAIARQGIVAIPTVSIVADVNLLFSAAEGVYVRREPFRRNPVNAEFITADGSEGFQIDCGLEMQGQTSPDDSSTGGSKWKSLKLGLRLFFQGEFGPSKLKYKVYEDSPVDEFDTLMLGGGHNNYWNYNNNDTQRTRALYVRDQFVANLQNRTGGLSHHGRFVHLYLNGLYWGLYQLHERPDESFQASYQGGEKQEYDVFKHDSSQVVAGNSAAYGAMWSVINAGLANNANYEQLQQLLDVPGLVDYLLINYWANNTDWDHKNLYASRRKQGGKWRFHAWDSEHTEADSDFGVLGDNNGTNPTAIFNRLLANSEFRIFLADRIYKRFFNDGIFYVDPNHPVYDPAFPERNPAAHLFMKMLQSIDTAIVCESARWGDVGPGRENDPHTRNISFYDERDIVMGYRSSFGAHSTFNFSTRSTGLMAQFRSRGWYPNVVAPSFNQHGGPVAAGFNLTMSAPAGTIYYTTNGTDPRVYGSGAISPSAVAYSGGPIVLSGSTVVKARVLSGADWSALDEATFVVAQLVSPLRITEIMYNPPGGDAYEFVELANTGGVELDLGGYSFNGINFVFGPVAPLAPGAVIVLANNANAAAFAARYPGVVVAGYYGGSLANGGERIAVKNAAGITVVSVTYRDGGGWPESADGGGHSLELVDGNSGSGDAANWQASLAVNGSPGQPTPPAPTSSIVINEVAAENLTGVAHEGTFPDWVELRNTSGAAVNLEGWSLSDDGDARKFVFPAGTAVSANGYLVVWCDAVTNTTSGLHAGFALDRGGEDIFLYNVLTQRVDAVTFGMQVPNMTIGRVGSEWTLTTPTPAAVNAAAALGAQSNLSINEWLANAAPGASDWLELYSRSVSQPVALRGIYLGTGGALFQVRSLSYLAAGGFVQLMADEGGGANHLDFKLAAAGSEISIYDNAAVLIEKVTYPQQVEAVSQGRFPNGSPTIVSFPASASPGASNYLSVASGVVLNEVLARNESALSPWAEYSDWIELANTAATPVNLGGMSLADSDTAPGQWMIPPGTSLSPNGLLRIWCDSGHAASAVAGPDMNTGFSLSGESGGVYLFNEAGQRIDSVEYGFQIADLSIGRNGGTWKVLSTPTPNSANGAPAVLGPISGVRVNEWMSEPLSGNDWFELYNGSASPVDLGGTYVTDDPSLLGITKHQIAPLSFVGSGGFVKLEASGDPSRGRNHVAFNLNRYGDALRLYDVDLTLIDSVDLVVLPPGVSAGRLPDGAENSIAFYSSPSPADSNYLPLTGVAINEILTHAEAPLEDAIELSNGSGESADVSGFYLSDSKRDLKKYRIAAGTTLAAGGFRVLYENQFGSGASGFALSSSRGGTVYLSAADAGGNLTGYRSIFRYGPQADGVSVGRVTTSVGIDFTALTARSFGVDNPTSLSEFRTGNGAANAAAKIGPVIINEIMYHPVDGVANAESSDHEYIELHNLSGATVSLFDELNATNTWRLTGGVTFRFPTGVSLGSRGYLILVHFDPLADPAATTAFRSKYGMAVSVPLYGPFSGRLGNGGDEVKLEMPDTPLGPGPGQGYVPYVVVDRVTYGASQPWPVEADGGGASLQRRRPYAYGNDPVNWKAAAATAGRANVPGSTFIDTDRDGLPDAWEIASGLNENNAADAALDRDGDGHSNYEEYLDGTDLNSPDSGLTTPHIVTQPSSATATPSQNVTFSVTANGSAPLQYQWRKNGFPIESATNASLTLESVNNMDSADYSVVVWNGAGFVASDSVKMIVVVPPKITIQPVGLVVSPGSNVTFTVAATGSGIVRYQWQKDGVNLAGETSGTLAINNAQLSDEAEYVAVVTDDIASTSSAGVRLVVKVPPTIAIPIKGSTNAVGSSVTLSFVANGSVPMGFQWRRGSVILTNGPSTWFVSLSRTGYFTITNLSMADSGSYRVVITNAGNFVPGIISPIATLLVVEPPQITSQPQDQAVELGANAIFNVAATGTAPLRYQWTFARAEIVGATNASYTVAGAQLSNRGEYRVVVSNVGASVTSESAILSILGRPMLSGPEMMSNGQVRVFLSGNLNRTYVIERSLNLSNWTVLGTLQYTNGLMPYVDTTASGATNRFYRARE